MPALLHFLDRALHVVAQVIKAQFVVGRIGDVGLVGRMLFGFGLIRVDHARGHPEGTVNLAHPFTVTLGEIIVYRDHMHAFARKRIQIGW